MLPSSGYFKNVPCPFFKSGYCSRNHCHFKHEKSAQCGNSYWTSVDEDNEIFVAETKPSYFSVPSSSNSAFLPASNTYIPTPVNQCNTKPILKPPSIKQEPTMPEYTPTPISRLKYLKSEPECAVAEESPKKRKYEEYEPRFVTCPTKRKVSFNLPNDVGNNDSVVEFSDDENDDDVGSEAKFSDEDYEKSDKGNGQKKIKQEHTEIKEKEDKIDKFSIVDQILVDVKKTEDFFKSGTRIPPVKPKETSDQPKVVKQHATEKNSLISKKEANEKGVKYKSSKVPKSESSKESGTKKSSTKTHSSRSSSDKDKSTKSASKTSRSDLKPSGSGSSSKSSKTKSKSSLVSISVTSKSCLKVTAKDKELKSEKHSEKRSLSSITKDSSILTKVKSEKDKSQSSSKHLDKKSGSSKGSGHSSSSSSSSSKDNMHSLDSKKMLTKLQDKKVTSSNSIKVLSNSSESEKRTKDQLVKAGTSKDIKHSKINSRDIVKELFRNKSTKKSEFEDSSTKLVKEERYSESSPVPTLEVDSDSDVMPPDDNDSDWDSDRDNECWQIWNESQKGVDDKSESENTSENNHHLETKMPDLNLKKRRIAHQGTTAFVSTKKPAGEKRHLNPSEVMFNRYASLNNRISGNSEKKETNPFSSPFAKTSDTPKHKLNVVPSSSLIAAITQRKEAMDQGTSDDYYSSLSNAQEKGKRVARVPTLAEKPRPLIPASYGSKVPTNIRQRYLNLFIDECMKFCSPIEKAYDLALEEENKAYERSSQKTIYLNFAVLQLNKLRHLAQDHVMKQQKVPKSVTAPLQNQTVSHKAMLDGSRAQKMSFSVEKKRTPKSSEVQISDTLFYESLLEYILTGEQLVENGFPLAHPTETGRAVISGVYANRISYCNDKFKRICCRCQKTYFVDEDADYVKPEECDYHWGRIFKRRIAGSFEGRYTCCQGDSESDGCCVGPGHVFDGSENHVLKGYVKTLPKTPPSSKFYGVYSLDCEMCYTTAGMELTRVSVINREMRTVYESFVKPLHRVLDYNTRFSGITEADLADVKTSIRDVQAVLLCMFNDKTIIIGHSLESDFKSLKLIHKTVVDTSVVFPHKFGLPYKRALKTLMAEKCNKIIQNNVEGHDSTEDAAACMELMLMKIKEDLRHSSR